MSDAVSQILESAKSSQESNPAIAEGDVQRAVQDKIADESLSQESEDLKNEQTSPEYDKFASKFAALSRKEKQIREKEQALEQRLKQIEEESALKSEKYKQYDSIPERIKQEPLKFLEEYGITPDVLAKMMVEGDGKPTVDMQLNEIKTQAFQEIEKLKAELKAEKEAQQQKQYEQTIESFKSDIEKFVAANDDYELIRENNATHLIFEVIETQAKQSPGEPLMTIEEAANAVESYLLDQAKKLLELRKIKGIYSPESVGEQAKDNTQKPQTAQATLSNALSAQTPSRSDAKKLSEEERLREAAKLIRWNA